MHSRLLKHNMALQTRTSATSKQAYRTNCISTHAIVLNAGGQHKRSLPREILTAVQTG